MLNEIKCLIDATMYTSRNKIYEKLSLIYMYIIFFFIIWSHGISGPPKLVCANMSFSVNREILIYILQIISFYSMFRIIDFLLGTQLQHLEKTLKVLLFSIYYDSLLSLTGMVNIILFKNPTENQTHSAS